jgi:hypothetical protein
MAIQEIEVKEAQGTKGIQRGINSAAMGLVMDVVQSQQYQKPIPSTVRELAANAVDAQSEKEKAIEILSGKCDPSKYFISRDGDLYADSNWDPSYYNLDHLNHDNNDVELIFRQGSEDTGRCDRFIVRDHGVGVGSRRLQGILEVGYSTKRNRKDALGAFGLGAKVGLATGAEWYNLTTVYNGVKYKVKIFNKKMNDLVGKFNLETEEMNVPYHFYLDNKEGNEIVGTIYGERTDEKNYTEVEIPVMRHHKYDFDTAVKTQLLFFNNVRYFHEDIGGYRSEVKFRAEVMYNSDNLIIAKDTPYSKPFVVIVNGNQAVGVCYGHIDFKELELQDMNGSIGVKCNIRQVYTDSETYEEKVISEGVDVIASREAIRWTPATREYLLNKFETAKDEATGMVEEELKTDDFLRWLEACRQISSYTGRDTALGRLSNIVDLNALRPKFKDTKIRFAFNPRTMFPDFSLKLHTKFKDDKDGNKFKTKREDLEYSTAINFEEFYVITEQGQSRYKEVYLASKSDTESFTTIRPREDEYIWKEVQALASQGKIKADERHTIHKHRMAQRDAMIKLLESSELYKNYDDVEVPEDWKDTLLTTEKGLEIEAEENRVLTSAEKRELEERVVANTLVPRYFSYRDQHSQTFKKDKVEPKFQEVKDYEGDLYYGYQVDDSKLQYAAHILYSVYDRNCCYNDQIQLLSVSKSNKKHFKMHKHIDNFFGKPEMTKDENGNVNGMSIVMDNRVVQWNTARIIQEKMGDLSFFKNFSIFNKEMTDLYYEVVDYRRNNYKDVSAFSQRDGFKQHHEDFVAFLDKLADFQLFIENSDDDEAIAEKAKELSEINVSENTRSALVVDTEMLAKLDKVLEYAKPIRTLLNNIEILTLKGDYARYNAQEIPFELQMEIKEYLNLKLN